MTRAPRGGEMSGMDATAPCPRCSAPVLRVSRRCLTCKLALAPAPVAEAEGGRLNGVALVLAIAVLVLLCVGTGGVVALLFPEARALRDRLREEAAVEGLSTIRAAQEQWRQDHPIYGTIAELGELGQFDSELASGGRSGYTFHTYPLSADPGQRWRAIATPTGSSGRTLVIDEQGAVFYREGRLELGPEQAELPADLQPLLR
ncbi:MAG: hypothetical protein R3F62_19570 [Planctomycetota bacterium]